MSNEEPKKHEKLGLITAILGSVAIILVAVISAQSIFPRTLFYSIVVVFAVAFISLLIYEFIYPSVSGIFRNVKFSKKQNFLVSKYSKEFRNFVRDFYDCARSDRSHSLKNLMDRIIQFQEGEGKYLKTLYEQKSDSLYLRDSSGWVNFAITWMRMSHNLLDGNRHISLIDNPLTRFIEYDRERLGNQKARFILEVEHFQYILSIYELMVKDLIDVCRATKQPHLLEKVKKEYVSFASDLDYFLKKYSDLGKQANQEFGEPIFRTYFEIPKTI